MGYSGFEVETPPPIADPHLRSLYQYWQELAQAAGGLPSIQAFDPLHLPKVLRHIWIVEIESSTGRFRVRLAGENINAIYGRNIGGQYFRDVYDPSDLDTIVARYGRCLTQPAIFRATGSVYAAAGRLTAGERFALPMLGRGGGHGHAVGRHDLRRKGRASSRGADHGRRAGVLPGPCRQSQAAGDCGAVSRSSAMRRISGPGRPAGRRSQRRPSGTRRTGSTSARRRRCPGCRWR